MFNKSIIFHSLLFLAGTGVFIAAINQDNLLIIISSILVMLSALKDIIRKSIQKKEQNNEGNYS
ncbi:hypothetical protein LF817_12040 [Halobacillus sp. A1]|uniref:hypothetical protein n=1 Tax=Halobacillus sp. A1 TaxID=2880262 RepID=UPI0020A69F59|nr:hypothetical protein [Halobacillus sp. A1]MCP3032077.1 hypothetical protein [Halobacillus sp. A1]